MTGVRKYELMSGLVTGLAGLGPLLYFLLTADEDESLLVVFLLYTFPAWLTALGSYFDAVRRRVAGRVLLLVPAAYYLVTTPAIVLDAVHWWKFPEAITFLIPPVMAVLTFVLSLLQEKKVQPVPFMIWGLSLALLALSSAPASAQKKFPKAIERSEAAGKIVELLAVLPDTGLPREVIERAAAVGVFPKVEKQSVLFAQVTLGAGVICARTGDGWTTPAFYEFGGSKFGFGGDNTYSLILLFMTKEAVAAFEKGGVQLKGEKRVLAGPVGNIADEQSKELEGAHILAYVFGGRLEGVAFKDGFMLNPDNNINKPLYGVKGREVLAGKKVETASLPAGITAYQEALRKYYGR